MKLKWNSNLVVNLTVICSVALMIFLYITITARQTVITTADGTPSFEMESGIDKPIPDTVGYSQYYKLKDSIKKIRDLKDGEALSFSETQLAGVIGIKSGLYCDTCSFKWYKSNLTTNKIPFKYYVTLPGWLINDNLYAFLNNNFVDLYVNHGQAYLRQNDKDIPVKYWYNHQEHHIMIPVSQSTYNVVKVLLWLSAIIFIPYVLYLIVCFLNFLLDLAKGRPFSDGNLRRLLTIAVSLLVAPLLVYLLNLVVWCIFHKYFTYDVILNRDIWKDSWKTVGEGIIFLLLYRAFRHGKLLKDEQDLTV
jgi:hypothetical protein